MSMVKRAEAEGGYQPLMVAGRNLTPGWRECEKRWRAIYPHLGHGKTIMDIGSHYGYFSVQAARLYKSFVWSIESGRERAEIQAEVLKANNLENVVLSNQWFTLNKANELVHSCFTADVILLLSVAHYFDPTDLPGIILALSLLSPVLIIEFPSRDEQEVAAKQNVHRTDIVPLLKQFYEKVEKIGEGESPKDAKVQRPIYKCSNSQIIREDCASYPNAPKADHLLEYDGQWHIDGNERQFTGLSLEDLASGWGMIYPDVDDTLMAAAQRYDALIKRRDGLVTDINIRNVLMSHDGQHIIDFTEGVGETIYDMPWETYRQRTLKRGVMFHFDEFRQMWRGTWTP